MQARLKTDVPLDNNNRPAMEVAGLECPRGEIPRTRRHRDFGSKK